jgi:hypothetical protein
MIGDDDWLNEPAKAIRGEAQPEFKAQFTSKVLVLLQRKAGASATDIFKTNHIAAKIAVADNLSAAPR